MTTGQTTIFMIEYVSLTNVINRTKKGCLHRILSYTALAAFIMPSQVSVKALPYLILNCCA